MDTGEPGRGRIDWIDYARGLCIVLVVMLYATSWVDDAMGRQGWLNYVVEFARPFRMPGFFVISGLLLSRTIGRPWAPYLDRKVLHFAYFYLLWLVIAFLLLGRSMAAESGWYAVQWSFARSFVEPFYWLWFIYMLPVFFVVTKVAVRAPVVLIWVSAAALQVAEVNSGVKVLDKFAQYYVFFYSGYAFAPLAMRIARSAAHRRRLAIGVLAAWAPLHAFVVFGGFSDLPLLSLALTFIGIAMLITAVALMPLSRLFLPVRHCGEHSIVIYLAFFIPAWAARAVLTRLDIVDDVGAMELAVAAAGILGPLIMHRAVRGTALRFLFERPAWLKIHPPAPAPGTGAAATRPSRP